MDFVWTPWRYRYIATATHGETCVFCEALKADDDVSFLILLRGVKNFVILNRYPYTPGHVMVVPYAHGGVLQECDAETLSEMMLLAKKVQEAIELTYHPDGYNLGMNVGRAAGAGITNHLHLHLLPRWSGDTNFMTTIAETRLEPEELADTYQKLRVALDPGAAVESGEPRALLADQVNRMLPLDSALPFDPAHAEEFFAALPARQAVALIEPRAHLTGARPLLLRTADLRRRMRLLLGPPDPASRRVNLRDYADRIRFRLTGSQFEQSLVQWQHSRLQWPGNYRQRLRLRPPALVKLNLAGAYPRAYVTRRIAGNGLFAGPFSSRRAADAFLESSLDLFRIRRCQIKIRRDPAFPGCIYSEMKMCLAPCFAGCTAEEYAAETARVSAFLSSGGASLADELSREREEASASLDFERAAALHRRLEKVDAARRGVPELVRRIEDLHAIVLQRGANPNAIAVFLLRRGRIADPFLLEFNELASEPRSVEQILRDRMEHAIAGENPGVSLSGDLNPKESAVELEDHLALLAQWFYSNPRPGEIFFEQAQPKGWPYRRILRACSRLLHPPESQS